MKFGSSVDNYERVFDFGDGQQSNNIILNRNGTTSTLGFANFTGSTLDAQVAGVGTIVSGVLTHLVGVIGSDGYLKLYQDGTLLGTSTATAGTSTKTRTHHYIGRSTWSGRSDTDCNIYYLRVYNTALTQNDVTSLYTNRDSIGYFSNNNLTSSSVRYTGSYFTELDVKGSLTNLSGTGYTSSDYRVKKNITSLDEADTIASLVPVSYTQNNLHHKKAIGFIAHEFAQSFPDLVTGEKDGPEMQSINYNGVIAILIKEIQTLRTKINELKSQI